MAFSAALASALEKDVHVERYFRNDLEKRARMIEVARLLDAAEKCHDTSTIRSSLVLFTAMMEDNDEGETPEFTLHVGDTKDGRMALMVYLQRDGTVIYTIEWRLRTESELTDEERRLEDPEFVSTDGYTRETHPFSTEDEAIVALLNINIPTINSRVLRPGFYPPLGFDLFG
jgi:hypothetical protein